MNKLELPSQGDICQAAYLLKNKNITSPLINSLSLKHFLIPDCLLPSGSYKMRGVEIVMQQWVPPKCNVKILSAGNLALAMATRLKEKNIPCVAIVPDGISERKYQNLIEVGAIVQKEDFQTVWKLVNDYTLRQSQQLIHPYNKHLMAGYATIIVEIIEAGFNTGSIVIPFGLGGLATALAHAIECFNVKIELYISEIVGFAPFSRATKANRPILGNKLNSFIEAMGTPIVLEDIYHYLQSRIAGVIEVTEDEVKREINFAAHTHHLRIEGAAGASLAAARKLTSQDNIFTLLTGANISETIFNTIISE